MYKGLDSAGLNVRTMSSMFKKNTFGVMLKIRKDIKDRRDVTTGCVSKRNAF